MLTWLTFWALALSQRNSPEFKINTWTMCHSNVCLVLYSFSNLHVSFLIGNLSSQAFRVCLCYWWCLHRRWDLKTRTHYAKGIRLESLPCNMQHLAKHLSTTILAIIKQGRQWTKSTETQFCLPWVLTEGLLKSCWGKFCLEICFCELNDCSDWKTFQLSHRMETPG